MMRFRIDNDSTEMKCCECGSMNESNKPGMTGRAWIKCRDCGEKTTHKPKR